MHRADVEKIISIMFEVFSIPACQYHIHFNHKRIFIFPFCFLVYCISGQGLILYNSKLPNGVVIEVGTSTLDVAIFENAIVYHAGCFPYSSVEEIVQTIDSIRKSPNLSSINPETFKSVVFVGTEVPVDKIQFQMEERFKFLYQKDAQDRWQELIKNARSPSFLQSLLSKEEYDESGAMFSRLPFPVYQVLDVPQMQDAIKAVTATNRAETSQLASLLERAAYLKKIVLIFDGLDLMEAEIGREGEDLNSWIPPIPENTYVVLNTMTQFGSRKFTIPPLAPPIFTDVIQQALAKFHKKLSPDQAKLLFSKQGCQNLLWISYACEELRLFGVFEQLAAFIKTLPPTLDVLLVFFFCFFGCYTDLFLI